MVWQYNIGEHGLESPSAANQVYAFPRPRAPAMRVDKVLLADAVVDADNAALEGGEVALNLIGVCVAAHVFVGAMVDRLVAAELLADLKIPAFVARTLGDVGQGRSSFAYQPDGKMRVTSGPWDGEKVVSKDQVLKVWHAIADARSHRARQETRRSS
jgi:hypothetical protein